MRIVIEIDGLPGTTGTVTTGTPASPGGADAGGDRGAALRPNDAAGARDGGAAPSSDRLGGGIGPTAGASGGWGMGSVGGPHAPVGAGPAATTDRSAGPAPASLVGPGFESVEQHAEHDAEARAEQGDDEGHGARSGGASRT